MYIMRKVAQAAGAGFIKSGDFNKFWPIEAGDKSADKRTWGTAEEAAELRKRIEKAHGIKLA